MLDGLADARDHAHREQAKHGQQREPVAVINVHGGAAEEREANEHLLGVGGEHGYDGRAGRVRNLGEAAARAPHELVRVAALVAFPEAARRHEQHVALVQLVYAGLHGAGPGVHHAHHGPEAGYLEEEALGHDLHVAARALVDARVSKEKVHGRYAVVVGDEGRALARDVLHADHRVAVHDSAVPVEAVRHHVQNGPPKLPVGLCRVVALFFFLILLNLKHFQPKIK